jgi:LysR family positive regulator for ilvC
VDSRDRAVFLSVCSTLNFTRSAETLHLSVSAVSRAVQRLEEAVGCTILERDRRSMRLTPAGETLRAYAERSAADWQALRRELASERAVAGEISLYCSVTASYSVLSPILERLRDAYPEVELNLHTGDQAHGIARVSSGRDDVAVALKPPRLPRRLDFLSLARSPLRLWVPAQDCAVRRQLPGADGAAWERVPFIVPAGGVTKAHIEDWFRAQSLRRPRIYAQVAGHEAIVAMVALGLGVGFAPELVVRAGGLAGEVEAFALRESLPELHIGLAMLRQRRDEAPLRALREVAAGRYPQVALL